MERAGPHSRLREWGTDCTVTCTQEGENEELELSTEGY